MRANGFLLPGHRGMAVLFLLTLALWGCVAEDEPQLLEKAKSALVAKDLATAEIHLRNLLQKDATHQDARLLLADLNARKRDWRAAERGFRALLEQGADPDVIGPRLLEAMWHVSEPARIVRQAADLVTGDPKASAAVAYWSGSARLRLNQTDGARGDFETAVRLDPALTKAKVALLSLVAIQEGYSRAELAAKVDEILAVSPDSVEALLLQATSRISAGQLQEARASLLKAIERDAENLVARTRLSEIDLALGNLSDAEAQLTEILQRAPGAPVALTLKARIALQRGQLDTALETANQVLRRAPEYRPAMIVAGAAYLYQGSTERAEDIARRLVKQAPDDPAGVKLLAAVHLRKGDPDQALSIAKSVLDHGKADAMLLGIAGEAALKSNQVDLATRYFEQGTALDKNNPSPRFGLALTKLSKGDRAGGIADLETAADLTPGATQADLALIAALLRDKRFGEALAAIDKMETTGPTRGVAHNLRGLVYLGKSDRAEARRSFEAALAENPALLAAAANLASLDLADGRPADARRRFDSILATTPRNASALLALARVVEQGQGSLQEVGALLERAHEADPASPSAALALAKHRLAVGQAREAALILQRTTLLHPDRLDLLEALAVAYLRSGAREQGLEVIDKAARLRPQDGDVQYRMGVLKSSARDYEGALARFREAQALQPRSLAPRVEAVRMLARLTRWKEADEATVAIQKAFPKDPAGWIAEGDLRAARGKWQESAASYRRALSLAPRQSTIAVKLHLALARSGAEKEANQLLKGWLREAPDDIALNMYAGNRELGTKRFAEAVRHFQTVVSKDPRNAIAQNNLGWSLHQLGDPRALAVAEEAYRLAPQSAAVTDTLATILTDVNQIKRGLELHKRAVTLAQDSPDLRLRFAQALLKNGDVSAARTEFETLIGKFPDTPEAKQAELELRRNR